MSEETPQTDTPSEPKKKTPSRPKRPDGTFMSQKEIDSLKEKVEKTDTYIADNNKVLMRGTGLSEDHFNGMNPRQINQFLLNWHKKKESEAPPQDPGLPNSVPITGTPTGSGEKKALIDQFLTWDLKNGRPEVNLDVPCSIAFEKHINKEEAKNKWLEAH